MDDWMMQIENTLADPYATEHVIQINGSWAANIVLYTFKIAYDPEIIEIVEVNVDGCVGEGYSTAYAPYNGSFAFVVTIPPSIPPGEGKLANLVVNILIEEGITDLTFTGGFDSNRYKDQDGGYHEPTLYDGSITIGEGLPDLTIESITGGFGATATIKNIGEVDATAVNWSITFDGGIIFIGKETTGTIASLPPEDEETISAFVAGFGKSTITISATSAEGASVNQTASCFVLVFFVLGVT